jgi:hypothetical protein
MTRLTELMMNDISFKAKRPIYSMDILCDIAEQNLDYAKQFIITVQPVFFIYLFLHFQSLFIHLTYFIVITQRRSLANCTCYRKNKTNKTEREMGQSFK